ncbi:hypothetical protein Tco_0401690 [Tanacetum coccineum]
MLGGSDRGYRGGTTDYYDRVKDTRISSLEALVTTLVSQTTSLQTQLIVALGCIDTLEAREPAHTDDLEDANSCKKEPELEPTPPPPPPLPLPPPPMIDAAIRALISRGVVNALDEQKIHRNTNLNGDGSQGSGSGEGVVGLTQWFERIDSVFYISNCAVENQVKFATYTLQGIALTWWNNHVKTVGHDAAYSMPWKILMKMMTAKYCPRNDLASYTQRFQELALMCGRMFPDKSDKVKKYVGGLPDMIQGSVMASKPKEMHDTIEFTTEQIENKRKQDDNFRDNQNQQQQNKRQNTGRAYTLSEHTSNIFSSKVFRF